MPVHCSEGIFKVSESCSVVSDSLQPHGLYSPKNSLGQNTRVGSHLFLQGIFPTQGLNQVSRISGGFLTSWATREALLKWDDISVSSLWVKHITLHNIDRLQAVIWKPREKRFLRKIALCLLVLWDSSCNTSFSWSSLLPAHGPQTHQPNTSNRFHHWGETYYVSDSLHTSFPDFNSVSKYLHALPLPLYGGENQCSEKLSNLTES